MHPVELCVSTYQGGGVNIHLVGLNCGGRVAGILGLFKVSVMQCLQFLSERAKLTAAVATMFSKRWSSCETLALMRSAELFVSGHVHKVAKVGQF
jgi:hypothetical protein